MTGWIWKKWESNNNGRLFMVPHLVRARGVHKGWRVCAFHQTVTRKHEHTCIHSCMHACVPHPHMHTDTHTDTYRHYKCMHFWWLWKSEEVGFQFWLRRVKKNAWQRERKSSRRPVWCGKKHLSLRVRLAILGTQKIWGWARRRVEMKQLRLCKRGMEQLYWKVRIYFQEFFQTLIL